MRIIAHRCRGFGAPENTLLALKRALASPVDEVEVDLQLTKDEVFVMVHSPWLFRGKKRTYIDEWTLEELRKNHRREFATLDEVLATFKKYGKGKLLNLDIKTEGWEQELLETIKKHDLLKEVIIVSWIPHLLQEVKRLRRSMKVGYSFVPLPWYLTRWKLKINAWTWNKNIIYINDFSIINRDRHPRAMHGYWLTHLPKFRMERINILPPLNVNKRIVQEAKKRGIEVCAVNTDTKVIAWRMKKLGVDALMTNKPRRFVY